ncbi:MAG: hypothetical protein RRA35_00815 [Desulfomonilia bacterium]|nr:hypothetical protein [Desulfomonilia bacterium]
MKTQNLIDFLRDPQAYPEKPGSVNLVQTHISWVFIGDRFVYKIKKPVDFGFLDFTSLEKRRFYTHEELRLNKRFSPDVYLCVLPISRLEDSFLLGDESHVEEYALKMKRISEDHMLYRLLLSGTVSTSDMERVGRHLATIYKDIPSDEKSQAFGTLQVISGNVRENFDQTRAYRGGPISEEAFRAIEDWSLSFMEKNQHLFEKRIRDGHIKDCHGDLHLQHICLEDDTITVFDCIEFNERFRFGDVASDVAFLSMDCDFNRHGALGDAFVDSYIATSGDSTLRDVLKFYKVYRSYVRAKVISFMLDDTGLDARARNEAFHKARNYYDLAHRYVTDDH